MGGGETQDMVMKTGISVILLAASMSVWAKPPSTLIFDQGRNEIIECRECNIPRPVASLTKVMTAIIALEYDSNLSKPARVGAGSKIPPGVTTRGDLFAAMLVRSDNQAAEILAQDYPGGRKAFIAAMNRKARSLGMDFTKFVDPSGLAAGNMAKIGEMATLIKFAALQPIIADTTVLPQVEVQNKKYKVLLDNTNKMLIADFNEIKFSKTGFTGAAGWNVAMILERGGQRFVVIVLGARDKVERYNLARSMIIRHFADIEYTKVLEQKEISMYQKIIERMFGAQ
jgi:D-alanyl-D-alanine endopeptidase (penicillin-binding protein 7)